MTKAKNVLPQDKDGESEAVEKTAENSPNGAEKNSQNDAAGTQDADAGQNAPAGDAGSGGDKPFFTTSGFSDYEAELISSIAVAAVRDALPQMLAEVEARRLADAERAAKELQDAQLAEQRRADQEQRNRERRQQREEQKAREKAAEARAVELQASAEFHAHIAGSEVPRAEIVERVQAAEQLLVMFADGKRFNIDLRHAVTRTDLKADGGSLLLKTPIHVPASHPADALTECWLIPASDGKQADCGLRCDLGSAIAIGGGRPVTFPAESIAWRC